MGDEFDGKYERFWPCNVHLIGKDILWFHAVYWPCMLFALDLPQPRCIFAHGWWMSDGKKMSKSLGNFISREVIAEICQKYSVDVYRYSLLRAVTFGVDGDFSHAMLQQRYNEDLANGVGNLLSRTVNMIEKYFGGVIPAPSAMCEQEQPVLDAANDLRVSAPQAMGSMAFHVYLAKILALADATNRYIEVTQPFKVAKDESQRERLATILYTCAEATRIILTYLSPVMPVTVEKGLAQLGWVLGSAGLSQSGGWGVLSPGTKTCKSTGLFPRMQ